MVLALCGIFKEMENFNSLSFTASLDKEYKISFY